MSDLKRNIVAGKVLAVTDSPSTTPAFDATAFSLMAVKASGTVTLTVHGCESISGTYLPVKDATGTAITIAATATEWIVANVEVFALPYLKFVGDDSATVTVTGKA